MPLIGHVYSGYASYDGAYAWGDPEHVAHKFVQILKGEPANGYAWLPRPSGGTVKVSTAQPAGAFNVWAEWGAGVVAALYPAGAFLIPIPSASCIALNTDLKGRKLAQAIVARGGNSTVVEAIHWHEEWPKARDGGERDPDKLLPNLRALNNLAKRPVVLIDDVITGGGHAVACARIMREFRHEVAHVVAAARTVKAPPDGGMFQIPTWDLEAGLFAAC